MGTPQLRGDIPPEIFSGNHLDFGTVGGRQGVRLGETPYEDKRQGKDANARKETP
jgi:hypothetical protein